MVAIEPRVKTLICFTFFLHKLYLIEKKIFFVNKSTKKDMLVNEHCQTTVCSEKILREFMGNNIPAAYELHTHCSEFSMQKWVILLPRTP